MENKNILLNLIFRNFIFRNLIFIVVASAASVAHARSCAEMVGQLIVTSPPPPPDKLIGGVILFKSNLEGTKDQTDIQKLVDDYKNPPGAPPRFISFDQEGGVVQRLDESRGFKAIPSAQEIGRTGDASRAGYWGGMAGKHVAAVGGNMNFSTVADLCVPGNPVIEDLGRCYSKSPTEVAAYAEQNLLGNMYYDVIPTLKHFPGHGSSDNDSHLGFANVAKTEEQLFKEDIVPFAKVLSEVSAEDREQQLEWNKMRERKGQVTRAVVDRYPSVMVGHLNFSNIPSLGNEPASLNRQVVTGWLREKLHHKGLIVTDDIGAMKAIRDKYGIAEATMKAIKAGNDLVIIKNDGNPRPFPTTQDQVRLINNICTTAKTDPLLRTEIADSYQRVLQNKRDYGITKAADVDPQLDFLTQAQLEASVQELRAQPAGGTVEEGGQVTQ